MKKDEGSLMRELCAGGEDREWMSARLQHGIGEGSYGICVGRIGYPRMNAVWHGWETHASKDGMYQWLLAFTGRAARHVSNNVDSM